MTEKKIWVFRLFAIALLCCSTVTAAEDSRALFNRGAELAAQGKFDEATNELRQAAVVRERTIAAKALSLLGQIAVASSKQNVAENPTETLPEQRETIFKYLQSAEQDFAESLSLQPDEEVRQYLETLRAWRNNMTNAWEEFDREQQRNAELQQRIRWLADWEEKLFKKTEQMLEEPDSPRKFQTEYESSREQKQLAKELTFLQEVPMEDEELKEQWDRLPEIQKKADEAAELLTHHKAAEALPKLQQVLDYLRSLLKHEQNQEQQNQEQQNQDQQNQDQQDQNQQQPQSNDESNDHEGSENKEDNENKGEQGGEQNSEMNEPGGTPSSERQEGEAQKEESPEERAERLLMQVQRKEQAAKDLREQLRTLIRQVESVEKDW